MLNEVHAFIKALSLVSSLYGQDDSYLDKDSYLDILELVLVKKSRRSRVFVLCS